MKVDDVPDGYFQVFLGAVQKGDKVRHHPHGAWILASGIVGYDVVQIWISSSLVCARRIPTVFPEDSSLVALPDNYVSKLPENHVVFTGGHGKKGDRVAIRVGGWIPKRTSVCCEKYELPHRANSRHVANLTSSQYLELLEASLEDNS